MYTREARAIHLTVAMFLKIASWPRKDALQTVRQSHVLRDTENTFLTGYWYNSRVSPSCLGRDCVCVPRGCVCVDALVECAQCMSTGSNSFPTLSCWIFFSLVRRLEFVPVWRKFNRIMLRSSYFLTDGKMPKKFFGFVYSCPMWCCGCVRYEIKKYY